MTINLKYRSGTIDDVFLANTFLERLWGYMFKSVPHHKAVIFKPCSSVHTFFMKFDLDVLFIDANLEVIKKVEGLTPGRVIMPVNGAKIVIEAKAGEFKDVSVGDSISIAF